MWCATVKENAAKNQEWKQVDIDGLFTFVEAVEGFAKLPCMDGFLLQKSWRYSAEHAP
jgi:hypothetical protein